MRFFGVVIAAIVAAGTSTGLYEQLFSEELLSELRSSRDSACVEREEYSIVSSKKKSALKNEATEVETSSLVPSVSDKSDDVRALDKQGSSKATQKAKRVTFCEDAYVYEIPNDLNDAEKADLFYSRSDIRRFKALYRPEYAILRWLSFLWYHLIQFLSNCLAGGSRLYLYIVTVIITSQMQGLELKPSEVHADNVFVEAKDLGKLSMDSTKRSETAPKAILPKIETKKVVHFSTDVSSPRNRARCCWRLSDADKLALYRSRPDLFSDTQLQRAMENVDYFEARRRLATQHLIAVSA